jgi:hypothetical protein
MKADNRKIEEIPAGSPQTLYRHLKHPCNTIADKYNLIVERAKEAPPESITEDRFMELMGIKPRDYELSELYGIKLPTFADLLSELN